METGGKMLIYKVQLHRNDGQQQLGAKRLQQCQIDKGPDLPIIKNEKKNRNTKKQQKYRNTKILGYRSKYKLNGNVASLPN